MWGEDDDDDLRSLDTGRWRENVIYRIAVLEERLKSLKDQLDSALPYVKDSIEFRAKQEGIEKRRDTRKTDERAQRAFFVALFSVLLSAISLIARYFGIV